MLFRYCFPDRDTSIITDAFGRLLFSMVKVVIPSPIQISPAVMVGDLFYQFSSTGKKSFAK